MRDHIGAAADRPHESADAAYERLVEEAARVPPGSDGVIWAPYLMGERRLTAILTSVRRWSGSPRSIRADM